jgi:hypothetical protein
MRNQGWLVRLEVRPGRDHEFETVLGSWRQKAAAASFAVRFGRSAYGLFEFSGATDAAAAVPQGEDLLAGAPRAEQFSVLASKLATPSMVTRGLLMTLPVLAGQAAQLEDFLRSAQAWVEEEPGTAAWFALHFASGSYGLFAAFPDDAARFEHLSGAVPRELTQRALALLGGVPAMDLLQVLA